MPKTGYGGAVPGRGEVCGWLRGPANPAATSRAGYMRTRKYMVGCQNEFIKWKPIRVPVSCAP